jgi:hypothetical protein
VVTLVVFAIDPGNEQSAWCLMNDQYQLLNFNKQPNREVMTNLLYLLTDSNTTVSLIDGVVIERVASYGMPVGREVFETCEWIGRYAQEAEKKVPVEYIYRRDEKLYLCFDSKAKDANIRAALIERFAKHDLKNGRGTKTNPDYFYGVKADIWAAIAVAVTYLDMQKEKKG